jgi:hypothetical protein
LPASNFKTNTVTLSRPIVPRGSRTAPFTVADRVEFLWVLKNYLLKLNVFNFSSPKSKSYIQSFSSEALLILEEF